MEGSDCFVLAGAQKLLRRLKKAMWLIDVTPELATDFGLAPEYVLETSDVAGYHFLTFSGRR